MKGSYVKCDRCGAEVKHNGTQIGGTLGGTLPTLSDLRDKGWDFSVNSWLFSQQHEGTLDLCPECSGKYNVLVKRLQGELNRFVQAEDYTGYVDYIVTDNPDSNVSFAQNMCYNKGGQTWVRRGGEEPECADVTLYDFMRRIISKYNLEISADTDRDMGWNLVERLDDGIDTPEGMVALLYTVCWVAAELRERLKGYEERDKAVVLGDETSEEENKT